MDLRRDNGCKNFVSQHHYRAQHAGKSMQEDCLIEPNFDCSHTFLIVLAPKRIPFEAKSNIEM